ncbi:MAG TPA: toll/interleukin-1 receptor domain-containing protein [Methyloceanibacter sp.]|nr:toll/interleukin-1 receptor domain-containing protein [Methyloceanibacter sp.]
MPGIFINYRRDDAPGVAGRLYDHLARSFSHGEIFIDVDAIKPGLDFVKQLDAQVSQCDVLLAIIGPHWLNAVDDKGRRRLEGDHDYVRIEIASALKRDIPVIPVLIDGASMPSEAELPEDLASLARRHALELRHTRFASDAEAIVAALRAALPKPKKSLLWPLVAAAAAGIVVGAAVWWLAPFGPTPPKQVAEAPAQPAAAAKPAEQQQASPPAAPASVEEAQRKIAEAKAKIAALQGNTPAPNAAAQGATPADAKPMPAMEGVPVALGDSFDAVKQAYPTAGQSGAGDLAMPLDGIRLFFTKNDRVLREIMLEAPYAGNVAGLRIGDSAGDVVARLGQPYAVAEIYGGSGYLYHAGGNILRYDLDKSNKVNAIVQILDRE